MNCKIFISIVIALFLMGNIVVFSDDPFSLKSTDENGNGNDPSVSSGGDDDNDNNSASNDHRSKRESQAEGTEEKQSTIEDKLEERKKKLEEFSKDFLLKQAQKNQEYIGMENTPQRERILKRELLYMDEGFTEKLLTKRENTKIQQQLIAQIQFIEDGKDYRFSPKKAEIKQALQDKLDLKNFLNTWWTSSP